MNAFNRPPRRNDRPHHRSHSYTGGPRPTLTQVRKQIMAEPGIMTRFVALESLHDTTIAGLATDRVHAVADAYALEPRERPLAFEILAGTIRRRATLDYLIERLSHRRTHAIEPRLLDILRMGLYQLLFLQHVPAHAAIDLACKLTRLDFSQPQVNFVNAVLRGTQRAVAEPVCEITAKDRAYIVPVTATQGIRFACPIFDVNADRAETLAATVSLPKWLIRRWLATFDAETVLTIGLASNARPTMVLRPNRVAFQREFNLTEPNAIAMKLVGLLAGEGVAAKVLDRFGAVQWISGPAMTQSPSFLAGRFQVQDTTAQRIVHELHPQPNQRFWDVCAGLGTKATQLAELTADAAPIVATDRQPAKLDKLRANAERLGLKSIRTESVEAIQASDEKFDVVLADVPCSNSGVLAGRAEVRWRLRESDIDMLAKGALDILTRSSQHVASGGRLAYSTCSIDAAENRSVVDAFLARHTEFSLAADHLQVPTADAVTGDALCDGGYWAILQRAS